MIQAQTDRELTPQALTGSCAGNGSDKATHPRNTEIANLGQSEIEVLTLLAQSAIFQLQGTPQEKPMIITAKYASTCNECGAYIKPGDRINWERGTRPTHATCPATSNGQASMADRRATFEAAHPNVATWRERRRQQQRAVSDQRQSLGGSYRNAFRGRQRDLYPEEDVYNPRWNAENRDEAEYHQGLAEDRRYTAEVKAYGREMADRFAMEDEMTRFWKNGEDY